MTPQERIFATLNRKPVDRPPVDSSGERRGQAAIARR